MQLKTSYQDKEFNRLIAPIVELEEYQKTRECVHHGTNRYDHMIRVAYYSYKITKFCHLNYEQATRASALHDFFIESDDNKIKCLLTHSDKALENALSYFVLTDLEQDVIKTHMFPIGKNIPKYLESWIVDFVDDIASIYERTYVVKNNMSLGFNMVVMMLFMLIRK